MSDAKPNVTLEDLVKDYARIIDELSAERDALTNQVAIYQDEIRVRWSDIEELSAERGALKATVASQAETIQRQVDEYSSEVKALKAEVERLKNSNAAWVEATAGGIADLKAQVQALREACEVVLADISDGGNPYDHKGAISIAAIGMLKAALEGAGLITR